MFYYRELRDIPSIDLPICIGPMENHSWHLFPIIIRPESKTSRNEFIKQMIEAGIGNSVHYKPLHRMTYYKYTYKLNPEDYPNTDKIWIGTVSLHMYSGLKENELKYICQTIKRILT